MVIGHLKRLVWKQSTTSKFKVIRNQRNVAIDLSNKPFAVLTKKFRFCRLMRFEEQIKFWFRFQSIPYSLLNFAILQLLANFFYYNIKSINWKGCSFFVSKQYIVLFAVQCK